MFEPSFEWYVHGSFRLASLYMMQIVWFGEEEGNAFIQCKCCAVTKNTESGCRKKSEQFTSILLNDSLSKERWPLY